MICVSVPFQLKFHSFSVNHHIQLIKLPTEDDYNASIITILRCSAETFLKIF
ncbi:hypothetical protein DICPUDRAFT_154469 [Dictyostelium purpureum]|uniref:Uncharacterized protein n=1 Tax=Dictyostelium purpureum TaxID=5786 RepID=F0ZRE7_DICPU|nr:uncharacterized protein DICPUDRAFT_154469 [Dictyostelium purpureum]EGC33466.1 hypothetical protein DICPUDRAFT_154469 [Dictyostelium purpureum]|eukprot:XP_003289989.1 hypothetical protein DICPUDRAFT_154469 [Dictyostelium purpureum]